MMVSRRADSFECMLLSVGAGVPLSCAGEKHLYQQQQPPPTSTPWQLHVPWAWAGGPAETTPARRQSRHMP